jgi:hypothetical protein
MRRLLLWASLLALAVPVLGAGIEVNLALDSNNRIAATRVDNLGDAIDVNGTDMELLVHCGAVDCANLRIALGEQSFRFVQAQETVAGTQRTLLTKTIDGDAFPREGILRVLNGTDEVFRINVKNSAATSAVAADTEDEDDESDPCWSESLDSLGLGSGTSVHFLITPGGSVQDRTTTPIDEDDPVFVTVISSSADLLDSIEVTRTSATRTTGNLNILGGSITGLKLQSRVAARCYHRSYELGDFAPGEAVVDLSARQDTKRTSLGTLRFNVNALYNGIVSFGPVWTNITDRTYGLAPSGGQQIIIETEKGGDEILYAAQYTYFRHRRDIEKPIARPMDRVNPTLGFSLNDPADHALIGVSFDAGHFVFTAGLHAARVERLSTEAGLKVGDAFTGDAAAIPTQKSWDTGAYFAVTIDARAAQVLINAILPGAK